MKLRKNEIISPKNFSTPHWIIRDPYQGIFDFLRREVDELIIYNVSALDFRDSLLLWLYTSLRGKLSDSLLSRISTWKISNLHVDIFYFPRGRHSFPPKFHLIPPKNFFFPTWKRKILRLYISKYPRGNQFSSTQHHIDL